MKKPLTIFIFLLLFNLIACEEAYTPKPRAYFRIDIQPSKYVKFQQAQHFSFEYPEACIVEVDQSAKDWFTLRYPDLQAALYLSYKSVDNNLPVYLEDARTMAFKHLPKASSITDSVFLYPDRTSGGMFYFIRGKGVASPVQFYVTDSTRHFVRVALYFDFRPNNDSIEPVINHIMSDMKHLAASLSWK